MKIHNELFKDLTKYVIQHDFNDIIITLPKGETRFKRFISTDTLELMHTYIDFMYRNKLKMITLKINANTKSLEVVTQSR